MRLYSMRRASIRLRAVWWLVLVAVSGLGATAAPAVRAQSVIPEEEYKKLIRVNEEIQPLGDTPFGERISLYDGSLSFSQVDVSVPGTGPTITVGREFLLHSLEDRPDQQNRAFGDWDIELPQIFTVTANQYNVTGWRVSAVNPGAICTSFGIPPSVAAPKGDSLRADWEPQTWWQGYQLRIPGQGSQELLHRTASTPLNPGPYALTYPIVTKNHWAIGCLGSAANDASVQAFLAVAPDGTKYWLDHMAYRYMPSISRPLGSSPVSRVVIMATNQDILARREGRLLVTRIEDRFGNFINYTYSGDKVTDIAASDGRHVTLAYESDASPRVSAVTVQGGAWGSRTWTYSYQKSAQNLVFTLTTVTQPDGSAWSYNLDPLNGAYVDSRESFGSCAVVGTPNNVTRSYTATITHPSGLSASYTVAPLKRGRSYVPQICSAGPGQPVIPTTGGTWATIPNASWGMALTRRVLSGAGLGTGLVWSYSYSPANESWYKDCSAGCTTSIYTDVTYPDGHAERSTFSNRYDWSESQLLQEDIYEGQPGSSLRRSTRYSYVNPDPSQDARAGAYTHPWGYAESRRVNSAQLQEQAPMASRQVVLDPANTAPDFFTWNGTAFDSMARPTDVQRYSSTGYGIYERTTFQDDAAHWVIGLTARLDNLTTGETVNTNVYDPNSLTLAERYHFGRKVMTYAFDGSGQLASFTDGNGKTTSLTNYKRGIPTAVSYPDGTSQSISVDDFGQITSITNQAGNTTAYGYDVIGRLARIDFPSGDSTAWAPKTFSYSYIGDALGVGGNHWMRLETQGAWSQRTDYDALMRPVFNGKAEAGTGRGYVSSRTDYDWKGRKTFQSYPYAGQLSLGSMIYGIVTRYDAVGRPMQLFQHSELGDLLTSTYYVGGSGRQTVDPKGNVTTTWFQTFDEPSYENAVRVEAPEAVTQLISRDTYGNPTSIVQGGITKRMVYDAEHRLCRTQEPESGSEVVAYDNAGNVAWSASGQAISGDGCGYEQVASASKTTRGYDAMNRVTSVIYPQGTLATSFTYDGLGNPATAVSATSAPGGNSTGTVAWTYGRNKLGLLTTEQLGVDGWNWTLGYAYDSNGNLASVQYPSGETVAYNPNGLGQATTVGGYASGVSYFPDGDVASYALGNGALYSAEKNARNLLSNFTYGKGQTLDVSEDLSYDANANITQIADRTASGQRTRSMSYDGLNRLTSATASNLWGTESYTYDTLNNIRTLSNTSGTNTYNYDGNNLLASISNNGAIVHAFQYDARGNTTLKDGQALNFDLANRLLAVPGKGEYMYDASGRRVKSVTPTGTTYYAYSSSGQLMWQYDAAKADGTDYIYLGKKLVASKRASTATVQGAIGLLPNGKDWLVMGWACATGLSQPIDVHVYVAGPDGSSSFMAAGTANADSEAAVQDACHSGGSHRFWIPVTQQMLQQFSGRSIYVYGISPVGGPNLPLSGSGQFSLPASQILGAFGFHVNGADAYLEGWACNTGLDKSIDVHLYVGGPAGTGTGIGAYQANLPSEQAVQDACKTAGGQHRFVITVTDAMRTQYAGQLIYIHGISLVGGANSTIDGSGVFTMPAPASAPSAPASVTAAAASDLSAITVSWGVSTGATRYVVAQSGNNGAWATFYSGPSTTTTISGPGDGSYQYRVQACSDSACSVPVLSNVVSIAHVPPAPANVYVPGTSSGAVAVSWDTSSWATSYQLEHTSDGNWAVVRAGGGNSATVSEGATGGWYYRVKACNANGCSGYRQAGPVSVTIPPAGAPSVSGGGTNLDGNYVIGWSAVGGASYYNVVESTNGGAFVVVGAIANAQSGFPVSGKPNGTYSYNVQACNAGGCGPWGAAVTVTVTLLPTVPARPSITTTNPSYKPIVHVTWSAVPGATSYEVLETNQANYAETVYRGTDTTWGRLTYYTGELRYTVRACNAVGCSQYSPVGSIYLNSGGGVSNPP